MQGIKYSRDGERGDCLGVQPIHTIEALGARQRQLIAQSKIECQLRGNFEVVLCKHRVPETLCADIIVKPLLARRAAASSVPRVAYTGEKTRNGVAASAVVRRGRDLRRGSTVEGEVARRPARLDEINPMKAAFRAKLEVMLSVQPTDRATEMVRVLAFPENSERLRTDGGVVTIAKLDEGERLEVIVEIGRESRASIQRIKV